MTTMSIDPSIKSCGWAIWKNKRLKYYGVAKPWTAQKFDWQTNGKNVASLILKKAKEHDVEEIYCEFPAFFGNNVTARSGSLVKLTWFVGFLDGLFTPDFVPFRLVPVNMWKGQLRKEIVKDRIMKIIPKGICRRMSSMPEDVWDAVGLGLYCHGRMK